MVWLDTLNTFTLNSYNATPAELVRRYKLLPSSDVKWQLPPKQTQPSTKQKKTEDYLPIKPEVILEEDIQSYQSPEFEFVSIPINLPSIKVELDTNPNKTEYIPAISFNNDCSKQKKKEEYFINNKGTQLRSTCKEGVCPNLALKGEDSPPSSSEDHTHSPVTVLCRRPEGVMKRGHLSKARVRFVEDHNTFSLGCREKV
uniref:Uncharacterized protein n=1 Tax=Timema douglasi TaxID=61478 RepID=A0A7R8VNT3_TIMDO|nr:unnamed protein product [Timema douglasi]